MSSVHDFFKLVLGSILVLGISSKSLALTVDEINQRSREITVLIDGLHPGSGVIISKVNETYFVLTANHVVKNPDEYTIITADGESYPVDYDTVIKLPGIDLAILEFTSSHYYPVALLADYDYDADSRPIFISGWPDEQQSVGERRRFFTTGLLIPESDKLALIKDSFSRGYDLFYTNITQVGMSGSPILDSEGRVIGIHGTSEGQFVYDERSDTLARVTLGYSSGIPIQKFLQSRINLNLRVETSPPALLSSQEIRALERFSNLPQLPGGMTAIDRTNRGNQLYRQQDWQAALTAFDQAISQQPNFEQAWYGRGNVLAALERFEEAIAAYDQAIKINPNFYLPRREIGQILMSLNRSEAALDTFNRALRLKPDDYVVLYLRGQVLREQLGKVEEAIASYTQSLEIKPDFVDALMAKAEALYQIQDYQIALAMVNQVLEINPQQEQAWMLKGEILMRFKQYQEALFAYEQAIKINPNVSKTWLLKAKLLAALDQKKEARVAALKALKLKPTDPEIVRFIRSLR